MKRTMFVAIAVLAIILGIVAYASAATETATVSATATVASKLELTAPIGTFDMATLNTLPLIGGALDPNEPQLNYDFQINVKSNKGYSTSAAWVGSPDAGYGFTFADGGVAQLKSAGRNHDARISFDPTWGTTPDTALPANLLFTVTY